MPFTLEERFVLQAEAKLGAKLPDSYRTAMMAANGGDVATATDDWTLYPILDSADRKRLARTCNDIVAETRACAEARHFPPQAVAIAHNGSGDQLVFLRAGDRYGPSVNAWSHETGALTKVADDFLALTR